MKPKYMILNRQSHRLTSYNQVQTIGPRRKQLNDNKLITQQTDETNKQTKKGQNPTDIFD